MPKLAAKDRKKVAKAEATKGGFDLIPPGKYIAELTGVESKISGNGNPMWVAEFSSITGPDGTVFPGRQWYQMMLPTTDTPPDGYTPGGKEKDPQKAWDMYQGLCAGRLKAFFEAFGYDESSDTDEMIGERVVLRIGVRTIQSGNRKGEDANNVNDVESTDSVDWADDIGGAVDDDSEF